MSIETESVASLPNDLLRFLPTLLTIAVLGGAAIVAMGGLKHHSTAGATTAPEAVAEAPVVPTALAAVAPVASQQAGAEVVYLVDSPKVQEALESSPTLKRGADGIAFSVMLIQSPEDEASAQQMLSGIASELTNLGIDLEVIDLRDSPPGAP